MLLVLTSLSTCLARLLLLELSLVAFIKHLNNMLSPVESPHQHSEDLLLRLRSTTAKPLLKSLVFTLEELNSLKELFLFSCVKTRWKSVLLLLHLDGCLIGLVLPFLLVGLEFRLELFQLHELFLHQDTKLVVF